MKQLEQRLKEIQRQLDASKADGAQKQKQLDAAESEKKDLKSELAALRRQTELTDKKMEKLSRKLKDLYSNLLLPSRDTELSHTFNNSQLLFRRADFNLFAANLRLDSSKIQSVHEQLTSLASKPRRRSFDALAAEEGASVFSPNSTGVFKEHVVANLQKTVQLTSELQDLKLQNQFLQRQLAEQASKAADEDSKQKQLVTFESKGTQLPMSIEELNHRLVQILKKLLNPNESAEKFSNSKQP